MTLICLIFPSKNLLASNGNNYFGLFINRVFSNCKTAQENNYLQCWEDEVVRKHVLKLVSNVVCAEVKTLYHSLADRRYVSRNGTKNRAINWKTIIVVMTCRARTSVACVSHGTNNCFSDPHTGLCVLWCHSCSHKIFACFSYIGCPDIPDD